MRISDLHERAKKVERTVLALVDSASEREAVKSGAAAATAKFAATARDAATMVESKEVFGVVVGLDAHSGERLRTVLEAIGQRDAPVQLLLVTDVRPAVLRENLRHFVDRRDVRLSLREFGRVALEVSAMVTAPSEMSAHGLLMSSLVPRAPVEIVDIVAGAAAIGDRRSSVAQLARLIEQSTRTVEDRMASVSTLGPKKLLLRMLALHALWRSAELGWSGKRIASAAGFSPPAAMSRPVERAVGVSFARYCRERTVGSEISRLADDLRS